MMSNLERLVYMANQIARNFEVHGHDQAVAATADHIAAFWDARMKTQIFDRRKADDHGLSPTAAQAIAMLLDKGAPAPQNHATAFDGASDAG